MKKILALLLAAVMLFALCACGADSDKKDDTKKEDNKTTTTTKAPEGDGDKDAATVKFGAAVYVSGAAATSATEDKAGQGSADIAGAAVLVADGKIVACDLDIMQQKASYDYEGKAIANAEFKTKRELGDAYNMVAYGNATQEWYAQADAFETLIVGKTVEEIKALMIADTKKGNDAVIAAGCTIKIDEFVAVIEKAVANATVEVAADVTVKVTAATSQTCTDATEDKDGSNKLSTTFFAAALKDGKVVAASSDCVEITYGFDAFGESKFDAAAAIQSKREKGSNYGMVAYGGSAKEWFEQADAFDAACVGLAGSEIAGLMGADYKGIDTLKAAGCTIYVSDFVAAASKI